MEKHSVFFGGGGGEENRILLLLFNRFSFYGGDQTKTRRILEFLEGYKPT